MIDSDAQDSAEGLASEESTNEISPTKMKQKKQQLLQANESGAAIKRAPPAPPDALPGTVV